MVFHLSPPAMHARKTVASISVTTVPTNARSRRPRHVVGRRHWPRRSPAHSGTIIDQGSQLRPFKKSVQLSDGTPAPPPQLQVQGHHFYHTTQYSQCRPGSALQPLRHDVRPQILGWGSSTSSMIMSGSPYRYPAMDSGCIQDRGWGCPV